MKPKMVEQKIDVEILAADLKVKLPPDKGKALAQFQHETGDPFHQGGFKLPLVGLVSDTEKVENVGVLEGFAGKVGLRGR